MNLQPVFDRYLPPLEKALRDALPVPRSELKPYYGMMHYHMGWVDESLEPFSGSGGKRLRPLLCLLVTEAVGGSMGHAMPAAVALELLHNFSLVHDDIEDNSDTRRGRPALWKIWGIPQAINVGDGLFAATRVVMSQLTKEGVRPLQVLEAIRAFDAACLALTEGQFLDMSFEERTNVTLDEYQQMIRGKTAALISVSCRLGAIIGGASAEVIDHYARFGQYLGLAFQIQDDWLGVWGEKSITGKPVGDDIRERKKNYPIVYALEQFEASGDHRLSSLYRQNKIDEPTVQAILSLLQKVGAETRTLEASRIFQKQALDALADTGIENQAQAWLANLSQALVSRQA